MFFQPTKSIYIIGSLVPKTNSHFIKPPPFFKRKASRISSFPFKKPASFRSAKLWKLVSEVGIVWRNWWKLRICHILRWSTKLGGGFKSFVFSPLFGEMIQFGLKPPTRIWSTKQSWTDLGGGFMWISGGSHPTWPAKSVDGKNGRQEDELRMLDVADMGAQVRKRQMEWFHCPIPDRGPERESMKVLAGLQDLVYFFSSFLWHMFFLLDWNEKWTLWSCIWSNVPQIPWSDVFRRSKGDFYRYHTVSYLFRYT